jgi:hypothetical protein
MNRTQLVPETPIHLMHTRERRGRNRFIREFPRAWGSLPLEVRDKLLAYWKEGEQRDWAPDWPFIQLVPIIGNDDVIYARCENEGYELYFRGSEITKLSVEALHGLILHELAHVYCYAIDHPSIYMMDADGNEIGPWESEIAVRRLLKAWKLYHLQDKLDRAHPGPAVWLVKD